MESAAAPTVCHPREVTVLHTLHDELVHRSSLAFRPFIRPPQRDDGHQLISVIETEDSVYRAFLIEDLPQPYGPEPERVGREQHVLDTRADAENILVAIVAEGT